MSALAGSAAEAATGARKKTKKVKSPRQDEVAEIARTQLEALQLRPPLTNGTNDHGVDDTSSLTLDPPREFGDTDIPNAPSEEGDTKAPNTSIDLRPSDVPIASGACTGQVGDILNNVHLPSVLNLSAHGECCKKECYGQNLNLLENLEEALVTLESALEEQRAAQGDPVEFVSYESELQMGEIMRLIQKDLSEPYSIYTYRYFIHNWPKLCFLAMVEGHCIGAIVCKLDLHRNVKRGYIAMLAVDEKYRKRKIGSRLVRQAIQAMIQDNADEVVLETEITNKPALRLYENLGFVRDKRLFRYYLNGVDALRLKLWLR